MSELLENARWVRPAFTRDGCGYHANEWFMFRNWLRVENSKAVTAMIAVDSKYWLYVNDQLVVREGGLKRGPVADGSYFDTVELSPYLHEGENSLALLVWYLGKHGFSHRDSGMPGLLFEVKNAALEASWKARVHPSYTKA